MEPLRWIMIAALTVFLAEGFALSVFPVQFRDQVAQLDPKWLQLAGLLETVVAAGLMAGILLG